VIFVYFLSAILTHCMLCIHHTLNAMVWNQSTRCTFCTVEAHSVLCAISRPDKSTEPVNRLLPWSGKVDELTQFIECLPPRYWCFKFSTKKDLIETDFQTLQSGHHNEVNIVSSHMIYVYCSLAILTYPLLCINLVDGSKSINSLHVLHSWSTLRIVRNLSAR
jgi:hypothetical protein